MFPFWELTQRTSTSMMFPNREQKPNMILLGRNRLEPVLGVQDQTDIWVRNWISALDHAHWKASADVLRQFPRAMSVASDTFLFPVAETEQGIIVLMRFPQEIALVVDLKAGTK